MERFSMNEFKPLSLMEKKLRVDDRIDEIESVRQKMTHRITEICGELSELGDTVRLASGTIDDIFYKDIVKKQSFLKKEKSSIENQLQPLREDLRKLHRERDSITLDIKRIPDGKAKGRMLEIRDKYMSFAADTTRVSSMRAMASRFVEEIQIILTDMP